jgi:hypothetical protein
MAPTDTTERVPVSEIVTRPDFVLMTQAQQTWVKLYLLSGEVTGTFDAISATKIAFPKTSASSLPSRMCHIQSHPKVKHILRVAFGEPENEMEPVLNDLRRAIRKSIRRDGGLSDNTITAIKFYEKVAGKKLKVSKANGE